MNEPLPLSEKGLPVGQVQRRDEGCRTTFSIDLPFRSSEVKKVWLVGEGGERLLLGTLAPEQGRLRLVRTLSHSSLRSAGLERVCAACIAPDEAAPDPRWQSLDSFSSRDPLLNETVRSLPEGSWRREGDVLTVRFPWRVGCSVPVCALFCLSEVRDGVWYVRMRNLE